MYESRSATDDGLGAKDELTFILLYYLTYNLFLKLLGVPRDIVFQNLTESVGSSFQNTLPYPLEYGKSLGKPLAVSVYADDHEFLLSWRDTFSVPGSVLHEITLFQIRNLKLKLNLGPIVFRNLCLNLPAHRTLDFNEYSIFSDTVR